MQVQLTKPVTQAQAVIAASGTLFLKVPGKGLNAIGWLEGRTLHCRRDPRKHFLRSLGAYGLAAVVAASESFDEWVIHLPEETLTASRRALIESGTLRGFPGYEPQIFLPVGAFRHEGKGICQFQLSFPQEQA